MNWFFLFFFLSGYCSLVCEIVWIRLSMASFGVNATVMSVMLSIFMAGLGIGSYAAGRLKTRLDSNRAPARFLRGYALCELLIAVSGLVMVPLFGAGQAFTQTAGFSPAWGSVWHHAVSGLALLVIVLPWAVCMGATFPLALAALQGLPDVRRRTSFSFLYKANLLGATVGTCCAAFFWIELLGLRGTLWVNALLNLLVAILAWWLSGRIAGLPLAAAADGPSDDRERPLLSPIGPRTARTLLFFSGFVSMGLELVWVRLYTPRIGTNVYAFAAILVIYLVSSAIGTSLYRSLLKRGKGVRLDVLVTALAVSCGLALLATDLRLPGFNRAAGPALALLFGVAPFCLLAGLLTPMVIDRHTHGDAAAAGAAYAFNIAGCIVGPLAAGFVLLPWLGERLATVSLALPLFALAAYCLCERAGTAPVAAQGSCFWPRLGWGVGLAGFLLVCWCARTPYDGTQPWMRHHVLKRDYEATTMAITGNDGRKHLIVNGVGMTIMTPITKTMAHFPLASLAHQPQRLLVVCFGMGTTFRAGLTWGIEVDAVDLVPAVPQCFAYFFPEAPRLLASPQAQVIVDDGRRFLLRTSRRYDVITIDPPPPPDSASSGLLYSTGFYRLAKARLQPGGILQQWYPGGDSEAQAGIASALAASFRFVRVFGSVDGWGYHFLASDSPIPQRTAGELAERCPPAARADWVEWGPKKTAEEQFTAILEKEVPLSRVMEPAPLALTLTDDRPVNEYYLVRQLLPGFWRFWLSCLH